MQKTAASTEPEWPRRNMPSQRSQPRTGLSSTLAMMAVSTARLTASTSREARVHPTMPITSRTSTAAWVPWRKSSPSPRIPHSPALFSQASAHLEPPGLASTPLPGHNSPRVKAEQSRSTRPTRRTGISPPAQASTSHAAPKAPPARLQISSQPSEPCKCRTTSPPSTHRGCSTRNSRPTSSSAPAAPGAAPHRPAPFGPRPTRSAHPSPLPGLPRAEPPLP